jgi:hypothetical protein
MGNGKEFSHTREKLSSNQMYKDENMNINLFLAGNFPPGFRDDFVYFA